MCGWYIDLNNLNSLAETKKASLILLSSLFHLNTYSSEFNTFLKIYFKQSSILWDVFLIYFLKS